MRYQKGTLEKIRTPQGLMWFIRFSRKDALPGEPKRPRFEVGPFSLYPTEAKASRAAQHHRDVFNRKQEDPKWTFGDVIRRFEDEEFKELAWSTTKGYTNLHQNFLMPKWGSMPLIEMKPTEIRFWLENLVTTKGRPASGKTKGHVMGQMHSLFRYAMLWEYIPREINPVSLFKVKGSTKRTRKPRVISPEQFRALLGNERRADLRAMYVCGYSLGLSVSEMFGLKWKDLELITAPFSVQISRAMVDGHEGPTKNQHRGAKLPLELDEVLAFRKALSASPFRDREHWVFASTHSRVRGKKPWNSKEIRKSYLTPAGKAIGLDFNLGWHALRHSHKVLLERAGIDVTVQRDLMRHSDVHTTMQVYGESEWVRMKEAHSKAVNLAFKEE